MTQNDASLAERKRATQFIWFALLTTVGIYGGVLTFLLGQPGGSPESPVDPGLLAIVLASIALGSGFASFFFRGRAVLKPRAGGRPPSYDAGNFDSLQTAQVIVWSLCESIAICGLVLGFISREIGSFLPFGLAALVLTFVHRPATWKGWPAG